MKTLKFEDRGQDFLEWDLDNDGVVIDCRPAQAFVWVGAVVQSHRSLQTGDRVEVKMKDGSACRTLTHPIAGIIRHKKRKAVVA